jgi:PhnB protein
MPRLAPWMSVADVGAAMAFYAAAFGARELERLEDGGRVLVAQLAIGDVEVWLQEDAEAVVPIGGGPMRLILSVDDPDTVFASVLTAGAREVKAVYEGHGWRIGRVADPFGYHWEIGKRLA